MKNREPSLRMLLLSDSLHEAEQKVATTCGAFVLKALFQTVLEPHPQDINTAQAACANLGIQNVADVVSFISIGAKLLLLRDNDGVQARRFVEERQQANEDFIDTIRAHYNAEEIEDFEQQVSGCIEKFHPQQN